MAITIISNPPSLNSVHNTNKWVIDSTKKLNTGFRYILKIEDVDTGLIIFQTNPIAPRPVDGYGEFDVSAVLKSVMNSNIVPTTLINTGTFASSTFKLRYRIIFGESYIQTWPYTDTTFVSDSVTQCVQSPGVTHHAFSVGDAIIVRPTDPSIRPTFQGLYNVIAVPNAYSINVSANWQSTPLNPGTISFADNRKTNFDSLLTSATFTLYNCVIPTFDWPTYNFSTSNVLTSSTPAIRFLFTNFKDEFYINKTQDLFWPFEYTGQVKLYYQRNDGAIFTKTINALATFKQIRYANVALKSGYTTGTGSLFNSTIKYYDFWVTTSADVQISHKYRIYVTDNCKSSDIEILFEDRMGGYNSFAFEALHSKSTSVTKETYNQPIQMSGSTYNPETIQGTTNITVGIDETYTLMTKTIINRSQYQYFEELVSSPNTYIKLNGKYQKCDIVDPTVDSLSDKRSGLRRRTIQVKLTNKNNINY